MCSAELQGLANVILTPHIGGSTEEAQAAIGREVATSLIKYVNRGTTTGAVNFPQVCDFILVTLDYIFFSYANGNEHAGSEEDLISNAWTVRCL